MQTQKSLLDIMEGYASWLEASITDLSLNSLFNKSKTLCETMGAIR